MHLALLLVGKRQGQVLMATSTPGLPPSRLFFVTDRCSGLRFLVDTGAEVSVLPVSRYLVPLPLQVTLCKQSTTPASRHLMLSPTPSTLGSGAPFGGFSSLQTSSTPFSGPTFYTTPSSWSMSPTTDWLTPSPSCELMVSLLRNPPPDHVCHALCLQTPSRPFFRSSHS